MTATAEILIGDVRAKLAELPALSVHCCVTSPPYWGLRDYGTGTWEGGDAGCDHKVKTARPRLMANGRGELHATSNQSWGEADEREAARSACPKCGARRVDRQIGSEASIEEYVATIVEVFRGVWRVLRDDGTLWLNLGDSYASGGGAGLQGETGQRADRRHTQEALGVTRVRSGSDCDPKRGRAAPGQPMHVAKASRQPSRTEGDEMPAGWTNRNSPVRTPAAPGLKPKDLCAVPWRVAIALQADGWYLRSAIVWHKPSPMPESVTDRPTKAHEFVFLLAKKPRYYYDAEAIAEPVKASTVARTGWKTPDGWDTSSGAGGHGSFHKDGREAGKTGYEHKAPKAPRFGGNKYGDDEAEESRTKSGNAYEIGDGRRNARDVWTIAAQPYKEAHFATYPEKLATRCILAGTSEAGCCATCGTPWERVVQPTAETEAARAAARNGQDWYARNHDNSDKRRTAKSDDKAAGGYVSSVVTKGWAPGCECDAGEGMPAKGSRHATIVPCRVLDPFLGSGTTLAAALKQGRSGVGIELNPEYAALARKRIAKARETAPLFLAEGRIDAEETA